MVHSPFSVFLFPSFFHSLRSSPPFPGVCLLAQDTSAPRRLSLHPFSWSHGGRRSKRLLESSRAPLGVAARSSTTVSSLVSSLQHAPALTVQLLSLQITHRLSCSFGCIRGLSPPCPDVPPPRKGLAQGPGGARAPQGGPLLLQSRRSFLRPSSRLSSLASLQNQLFGKLLDELLAKLLNEPFAELLLGLFDRALE